VRRAASIVYKKNTRSGTVVMASTQFEREQRFLPSWRSAAAREGIICIVGDQMLPKSALANHRLAFAAAHGVGARPVHPITGH
jgi:hypothetical protein